MSSILQRLDDLEATVALLPTAIAIDLRINSMLDTLGTFIADLELIKEKTDVIEFPTDHTYILTQPEVDFLRNGMSEVSKILVELETLRVALVRSEITNT